MEKRTQTGWVWKDLNPGSTKNLLRYALTAMILLACCLGAFLVFNKSNEKTQSRSDSDARAPSPADPAVTDNKAPTEPSVVFNPSDNNNPMNPQTTSGQPTAAQPAQSKPRPGKEPLQDPMARAALALVGVDPAAESYWYAAINNPNLSAHERQDLIEDLNETGLSNPRTPTASDLPIIYNRIQLIETVGPDAMDKVNADAFQEAYKDLVNLANKTN